MKHLAIVVLCLLAQSSFALKFGAAPVVDIEMGWKGKTTKSDKKEDDKASTAKKKKTEKKSNKTKKPKKEAKDKKTAEISPTTNEDGKGKVPEAPVLEIDRTIPPLNTLEDAIEALKDRAEKKYREMTNDETSLIKDVGAKGQDLNELGAYVIKRDDKFLITDFAVLSAEGGVRPGITLYAGDEIYGFHTGRHDTTLSNTDYKGLKQTNDKLSKHGATMKAEIAYDVAQGKTFQMGQDGVLLEQNDGKFISKIEWQRTDCETLAASGQTKYEVTEQFMESKDDRDEGAACNPAIKDMKIEDATIVPKAKTNHATTFKTGSANLDTVRVTRQVFGK